MSTAILFLVAGAVYLYAAYQYDKLMDRIADLEAQVRELELWRKGKDLAEEREIAREVAAMDPDKPLGEILKDVLSPPGQS